MNEHDTGYRVQFLTTFAFVIPYKNRYRQNIHVLLSRRTKRKPIDLLFRRTMYAHRISTMVPFLLIYPVWQPQNRVIAFSPTIPVHAKIMVFSGTYL